MPAEIQASEIRWMRELFAAVWRALEARDLDPSPAVPLLIGKTRYLVAPTPEHANGTPFAAPIEVDGVFFEGNLRREQALTETLRLLARLGVPASSPDVETPLAEEELEGDEPATGGLIEVRDDGDDEENRAPIGLGGRDRGRWPPQSGTYRRTYRAALPRRPPRSPAGPRRADRRGRPPGDRPRPLPLGRGAVPQERPPL